MRTISNSCMTSGAGYSNFKVHHKADAIQYIKRRTDFLFLHKARKSVKTELYAEDNYILRERD